MMRYVYYVKFLKDPLLSALLYNNVNVYDLWLALFQPRYTKQSFRFNWSRM